MEKVSVSKLMANHTQLRRGRRPYRGETLLKKEKLVDVLDIPEILQEPEKQSSIKIADSVRQELIRRAMSKAIKKGVSPAKAFSMAEKGGIQAFIKHAPEEVAAHAAREAAQTGAKLKAVAGETALRQVESQLGKAASVSTLAGFFDELDKIAVGLGEIAENDIRSHAHEFIPGGFTATGQAGATQQFLKDKAVQGKVQGSVGKVMSRYGRAGGSAARPVTGLLSKLKGLVH